MAKDVTAKTIVENFHSGIRDGVVIIFIPEKEKNGKALSDQERWAHAAHEMFGKLFGGATGFKGLSGSWFDKEQDKILYEAPMMIQSVTKGQNITEENIVRVLAFAQRMGRETKQACVGVMICDVFYELFEFEAD